MTSSEQWAELFSYLKEAKMAYEAAEKAVAAVNSERANAITLLMDIQLRIDNALKEEKKAAPCQTDWYKEIYPAEEDTV